MPEPAPKASLSEAISAQRIDKWLWFVRVVKTRSLATALVAAGKVRLNRQRIEKPAHLVRPGDVLTIAIGARIRVYEVVAPGERRGDFLAAQKLYRDLTPAPIKPDSPATEGADGRTNPAPAGAVGRREPGSGRPSKRDRRLLDRLRGDE